MLLTLSQLQIVKGLDERYPITYEIICMFTNVFLKGNQGLPGEIGAPGERGAGEPGAKVSHLHFTLNVKST